MRAGVGALLAALMMILGFAAPAGATVRKGSATDTSGDARDDVAGRDIREVAAQADDGTGQVGIAVRLDAPPETGMFVIGIVGKKGDNGLCRAPFVLFSAKPSANAAVYGRDTATSEDDFTNAALDVDGSIVTLFADDDAQLREPFDCAVAGTSPDGSLANVHDETDTVVALAADPPPTQNPPPTVTQPPAPPPAPAPAPAAVPQTTRSSTPPVPVPKEAKIRASLGGVPSTIRRNRTVRLKLEVANDGSKKSQKVTATVAAARGLALRKRTIKLAALAPGKRRTLTVPVKLTRRAKKTTAVAVSVRAGKQRTKTTVLLRIGKAKKLGGRKQKPAPGPVKPANPLVGTYWWRTVNHVDYAWDNRALYFVDATTVYSGFPKVGFPTVCGDPPAKPDAEFDERDGCLPYTYDAATGAVTIGDKAGTFKNGELSIDNDGYSRLHPAAPGQRFEVRDLQHASFSGMCGMFLGCTTSKEFLTLLPDGQFTRSRSTTSTFGDPGMGPFTVAGSYPPDEHGTYEVLPAGKIRLAYADGTVKEETFAILAHTDTGQPDPVNEGVMIGETNFYPDPSP